MRIRLYSDLHLEFHHDGGKSFVRSLNPRGVDLLVLAGDITRTSVGFEKSLKLFRDKFDCPIIYVHGNHEFYYSFRESVVRRTREAVANLRGVHWLDCDIVEIDGRRILGTPLWYGACHPPPPMLSTPREWKHGVMRAYNEEEKRVVTQLWPDFECIEKLVGWVYNENTRAIQFLLRNIREGDLVVTHMLPSKQCVSPQYERSPTNPFFVTELRHIIGPQKPALWMHGHTHDSIDTTIGSTRIVCNPLGYAPRKLNPRFNPEFTVDLPPLTMPSSAGTANA